METMTEGESFDAFHAYAYGETPEVVIRQQHDYWANTDGVQEHHWALDTPVDELLTVLGGLLMNSQSWSDQRPLDNDPEFDPNTDAYQLRISILAALGIKEG